MRRKGGEVTDDGLKTWKRQDGRGKMEETRWKRQEEKRVSIGGGIQNRDVSLLVVVVLYIFLSVFFLRIRCHEYSYIFLAIR